MTRPTENTKDGELSKWSVVAAEFWQRVDMAGVDECWEWEGRLSNGYGNFQVENERYYAHRLAYRFAHGSEPNPQANHHCDNRTCVNPRHIYSGTPAENMKDNYERNEAVREPMQRYREDGQRGEGNSESKLTKDEVIEIKNRLSNGESINELEPDFAVSKSTLRDIREGRIWEHVEI
jgi:hypothetical protein